MRILLKRRRKLHIIMTLFKLSLLCRNLCTEDPGNVGTSVKKSKSTIFS
jgi:hypothetical protein